MKFPGKQILLLIIGFIFITTCLCQKRIQLDSSFRENSDVWVAKIQKKKPRKFYELGPYKILDTKKTDSLKKSKEKFFRLRPLFGKDESEKWESAFHIRAGYDHDTASIDVTLQNVTYKHTPGFFSKQEESTDTGVDSVLASFRIQDDTTYWIFRAGSFRLNSNIEGTLSINDEEYYIESQDHFEGKKKGTLGPFPKGVVIKNSKGAEIGAIQLRGKYYTWIRKDLTPPMKFAVAISLSLVVTALEKIGDNF